MTLPKNIAEPGGTEPGGSEPTEGNDASLTLEDRIITLNGRNRRLEDTNSRLTGHNSFLRQQIEKLRTENNRVQTENGRLQAENERLTGSVKQYVDMYKSLKYWTSVYSVSGEAPENSTDAALVDSTDALPNRKIFNKKGGGDPLFV